MKKRLSVILSLSLAMQPAFGAFEGVKKKVASVKEVMAKSRAFLKENWNCLRHGTGPQCTKEQRSALVIIHDFVSGQWAKAGKALSDWGYKHPMGLYFAGVTLFILVQIATYLGIAFTGYKITAARARSRLKLEKGDVNNLSTEDLVTLATVFNPKAWEQTQTWIYSSEGDRDAYAKWIHDVQVIMDKVGWKTRYNDETLGDMINHSRLTAQEKQAVRKKFNLDNK